MKVLCGQKLHELEYLNLFPALRSLIYVLSSDYPCVKACPASALSVDEETGAVRVNEVACILCGTCINACPGKVSTIVRGKNYVVIRDLCGEDPECVKTCSKLGFNALTATRVLSTVSKLYVLPPENKTALQAEKMHGLK